MAAVLTAIVSLSVSAQGDGGRTRTFRYLMGTSMRVEVSGSDDVQRQQATEEAFAAIAEVDRVMSDYRNDSELAGLNAHAGIAPVVVSPPLFAVLAAARRVNEASGGAFTVVKNTAAGDRDQPFRLDLTQRSVTFTHPGVQLTLSGLAKGFAAEVAAGSLARRGLAGTVDTAGVQFMVGTPPGKTTWSVGIGDPDRQGSLIGAVEMTAGAVATATSGAVPQEPGPGRDAGAVLSATVLSPDGTLADALSRAALVMEPSAGLELLSRFPGTWGVLATRAPNGPVRVSVSPGHERAYHPSPGR